MSNSKKDFVQLQKIQKAISKKSDNEVIEYLSKGNDSFYAAISAMRNAGTTVFLMSAILFVGLLLGAAIAIRDFEKLKMTSDWPSLILGLAILVLSLGASFAAMFFASKLRALKLTPKQARIFLVTVLVLTLSPIIISINTGNFFIPGALVIIMIVFLFSALDKISDYEKWFRNFK